MLNSLINITIQHNKHFIFLLYDNKIEDVFNLYKVRV